MKKYILFSLIAAAIVFLCVTPLLQKKHHTVNGFPVPTEGEENERLREKYNELRHRAAPGTDWKTIERVNSTNATALVGQRRNMAAARPQAIQSFANGAINGVWEEKGALNITGSIRAVDYTATDNKLYVVSSGGSLWSSVLGSESWSLLNQSMKLDAGIVKAFDKAADGKRILVSLNNNILYSDDEGSTFSPSTGISFPVEWGGNYIASLIRLNDGSNTIYCLTRTWSNNPWAPRYWLFRSTNEGASFSFVYQFNTGGDGAVSLCNPYNSNAVYATEANGTANTIALYSISGTAVTPLNTFNAGQAANSCIIKGTLTNGFTTMYALVNNTHMYKIINSSGSWVSTFASVLPEEAWGKLNVSPSDATKVFYGGVNAFKSSNSAQSFTKINEWWEYYGNEANKLHADIMEIEFFKKSNNTEFAIIDCHGGVFSSTNLFTTAHNESLSSLIAVEYYDIITDTLNTNIVFGGTQDQGLQHTLTANSPGVQNFKQLISGDYGQMSLTKSNTFLWVQYPGADMSVFTSLNTINPGNVASWQMGGTEQSNYGWMLPSKSTTNLAANEVWIGGGNINGGGGSYLAKATLSATAPYTVSATQFSYNFRANSNSGTAGVTAIEQSHINSNMLYVATEDGSFFYSSNQGTSWTKTSSFSGPEPWYLYGSCILASKVNQNTVWFTGSGYSNPPVYKSVDGGATFTAMSNGLPATLVNEIVASPDEAFLFAATEAGPYVYVTADNTWYPLFDATTPVQSYTKVEYIRSLNTVRFATMGRGIWDFKLAATYTFTGNGNWNVPGNWLNNTMPPANLSEGSKIIIDPVTGGECVVNIPVTIPLNCILTVNSSKKLRVNGNLTILH
jgi:hypothetical protein